MSTTTAEGTGKQRRGGGGGGGGVKRGREFILMLYRTTGIAVVQVRKAMRIR